MYHNLKAFQVEFNLKSVKGKKTPYLDNDVVMNAQKDYLNTRIELGNNDFRDQRILVSKNSYVAKIRQKCPRVSHFMEEICAMTNLIPSELPPDLLKN